MKALRRAAIGLAVLVSLMFLWLIAGDAYARYREGQVERAWVQSFGPLQDLLDRYPKAVTNDTARRIELLVKSLGLDLTPKAHDAITAEASSSSEHRRPGEAGRYAASLYLSAQLEKPEERLDPPAADAREFLLAQAGDLRAIEAELLASPPPVWDFDPAAPWSQKAIPDTFSLIQLQRVLLAKALEEFRNGDRVGARRTLEASWKLNRSLRRTTDASCQIIALGIATRQAGVLRKIDVDPALWRARLTEHDYKRSRLDTELLSSWPSPKTTHELEDLERKSERDALKRLWNRFLEPYGSLVWSQVTDGMRKDYIEIRDSPLVRDLSARSLSRKTAAEISLSIFLPNTHSSFRRVDEYLLDAELTDKVLQARELRQRNGGKWPAAIPGIETTRLPAGRWIYTVSPQGVVNIELSQNPYKDRGGFKLPFRFTSS